MPGELVIDEKQAREYMNTFDAAPREEQEKRIEALKVYATHQEQVAQEAILRRTYSDFDTFGGTWDPGDETWDDEEKAEVANRKLIAFATGKTPEETVYAFPILLEEFAQKNFKKSGLTNRQFYDEMQKSLEQEKLRKESMEKLFQDTLVTKMEDLDSSPVERFQKWKEESAEAYPDMDEAEMLAIFTREDERFSEIIGENGKVAGEIIRHLDAATEHQEENYVFLEQVMPAAERLAQLPEEDQNKVLEMVVIYARAKGVDPKGLAQRMLESFQRVSTDVQAGAQRLYNDNQLEGRRLALRGEIAGQKLDGVWVPVGHFNADDLAGSLKSVWVDPQVKRKYSRDRQGATELTKDQITLLEGEVERQARIATLAHKLRRIVKDELDPVASTEKGMLGFFENTATGVAGAVPYMALAAIPYAGVPAMTTAITFSEYERIRAEHDDLTVDEAFTLATYSGVAQGFSTMLSVKALQALPFTSNFIKSLSVPSATILGRAGNITKNSLVIAGEQLVQGEVTAVSLALIEGFAVALEKDQPGVNWTKALSVFVDTQPGTLEMMVPLWMAGTGMVSIRQIRGGRKLVSNSQALESLGIPKEDALRIAQADPEMQDALFVKAFTEMPDSQKRALVEKVDSYVVAAKQRQRSNKAPTVELGKAIAPDGTTTRSWIIRDSKGKLIYKTEGMEAAAEAFRAQDIFEQRREMKLAEESGQATAPPAEPAAKTQDPAASGPAAPVNRRIVQGADIIAEMEKNGGTVNRRQWDEAMRKEYDGIEPTELDTLWAKSQDAYLEQQINAEKAPLAKKEKEKQVGEGKSPANGNDTSLSEVQSMIAFFDRDNLERGRAEGTQTFLESGEKVSLADIAPETDFAKLQERMRIEGIEPGTDPRSVTVLGENIGALREGVYTDVAKIHEGATAMTVVHERLDGETKRAMAEGTRNKEWFVQEIQKAEVAMGETLLVPGADGRFSEQSVVEAVTKLGEAYFAGRIRDERLPTGLRRLFREFTQYFREVFARAGRLRKAIAEGKVSGDFHAYLAESVGLPLEARTNSVPRQHTTATGNEVRDVREAAGPKTESGNRHAEAASDERTFSLAKSDKVPVLSVDDTRTKNFKEAKEWLTANLVGKPIPVPQMKAEVLITKNSVSKMGAAGIKSASGWAHIAAIEHIPELANVAFVERHPDRNADRHISTIHRLYAPMQYRGILHRVKLTVKEFTNGDKTLYSLESVEIEEPASYASSKAALESMNALSGGHIGDAGLTITVGDLMAASSIPRPQKPPAP